MCPNCGKRLPLSGRLCMRGTTGIYCRGCHRTVQVSMEIDDDETSASVENET